MSQVHEHHHHDHGHAENDDPYYLDQMCLVALSAAFGAICLSLYFWQYKIMTEILASQFHVFVLISGVMLLILAVLRGISLWIQVGKETPFDEHDHGHHHHEHEPATGLASLTLLGPESAAVQGSCDHHHGHGDCGHDHHHEGHTHTQAGHTHSHGHSHGHGDHDHNWAPWRYIALVIPIIVVFLARKPGLEAAPNKVDYKEEALKESLDITAWLARGDDPFAQAGILASQTKRRTGDVKTLDFKTMEKSAGTKELRDFWAGQTVRVVGQFNPGPHNRVFFLCRQKINCCVSDLVQLNVPIYSQEPIKNVKINDWIEVIGEIRYRKDASNTYHTQLTVQSAKDVELTGADLNPYISGN